MIELVAAGGFGARDTLLVDQPSRAGAPPELSIAKRADGGCVFHEDRRCSIQVKGGESALPTGCRHYPRILRIEPHIVHLSLSHYCPTAAALLVSDQGVTVVRAERPLALAEPIEGLDARDALPPLLRPDLLMDLDAYADWERSAVALFSTHPAGEALRHLAASTDALRGSPAVSSRWASRGVKIAHSLNRGLVTWDAIPDLDSRWEPVADARSERVLANYLAARAFGNWIAYQGRGLRTIVAWLHACYDVARTLACRATADRAVTITDVIEAIRQTDYVMLHTIDTQQFADAARPLEE